MKKITYYTVIIYLTKIELKCRSIGLKSTQVRLYYFHGNGEVSSSKALLIKCM